MYLVLYFRLVDSCFRACCWAWLCIYWCTCCGTWPGTRLCPCWSTCLCPTFWACKPALSKMNCVTPAWTCGKRQYNAVTGMRGAWICRVDENGHLNSARTSGCKRGPLSLLSRDLVLKPSQTIKKLSIVNLSFPCAIMTSRLRYQMVVYPQMQNPTKVSKKHRPHHIACLCGAKQTAKHNAHKFYTWFKFSVTAHWRNIPKYIGLENIALEHFSWRVQSDSDGFALSSPNFEKRKCVSTSHMRRDASWMHRDTRHI